MGIIGLLYDVNPRAPKSFRRVEGGVTEVRGVTDPAADILYKV